MSQDIVDAAGEKGERLHLEQLPPGFVQTEGKEVDLGSRGLLTYTVPGGGDPPRVTLLRYRTTQPLERLTAGTEHRGVAVQGKPAVESSDPPNRDFLAVAWMANQDVAMVVSAYKISESQLLAVADHVHYMPGIRFDYQLDRPLQ